MITVNFVQENKKIEARPGISIAALARRAGVFMETPCGGGGTCGKCKVKVVSRVGQPKTAPVYERGKSTLRGGAWSLDSFSAAVQGGVVLACQTRVYGDIDVYTSVDTEANKTMQILNEGTELGLTLKNAYSKIYRQESDVTEVQADGKAVCEERGDTADQNYGVTIDIGTTTLVAALLDMTTGREITTASALNPQCAYAQDVVSRINYAANNDGGLELLYTAVRDEFNRLIGELCRETGISRQHIYEVSYAGNTTMLHLATNTDPYSLGRYPYTPAITGGNTIPAAEAGLDISPAGRVYLPPVISAYVGPDITAGVLSSGLYQAKKKILFLDIGTNGEMVLAADGKMTACSTAAGPAFEGMNITFGMRAGNGAIEYFSLNDDKVELRTIGGKAPKGICGSGLFDIAGELVKAGIIEKSGRLQKKEKCTSALAERLTKYEGKSAFMVAEGVYLTQADIRQIQLAKSAIRAGIEAMLGLNELRTDDLDEVYIAGSFGYHLRPQSLVNIGIIPPELQEKIKFVGNTSKTGGNAFLINTDTRNLMKERVQQIQSLELSDYPGFEALFVEKMSF
ncbi:MAG: ASKHA domain-containing protein [Selenomonadaceae bacterium]|nr:ASKHA domain-containing protein [Selenomonadaceae bacterium]